MVVLPSILPYVIHNVCLLLGFSSIFGSIWQYYEKVSSCMHVLCVCVCVRTYVHSLCVVHVFTVHIDFALQQNDRSVKDGLILDSDLMHYYVLC